MANTTFTRFASAADPTPNAALATTAFGTMPWGNGTNIKLMSNTVKSPTMNPNGAGSPDYNSSYWVEGTFAGHFARDPSIDLAIQSMLMSTFTSKVITPGSIEKPVVYEKTFFDGGASFYRQARGCQHGKMEIKWDADSIVDFSSDFTGQSDSRVTTMVTGATYAQPSATKKLMGTDVSVTIGSLTTNQMKKGSLSIDMSRKAQTVCGQTYAQGVGTSGSRTVNFSFSFYKHDFSFETALIGNVSQAVALTIGGVNTGYLINSANVIFGPPQDEDDDSGQLITISGSAGYDVTALADIKFTQL